MILKPTAPTTRSPSLIKSTIWILFSIFAPSLRALALKDNSISKSAFEKLTPEERANNTKIVRGVMHVNEGREEYTRIYDRLIARVQAGAAK